jgi:hypothetical protein
MASDADLVTRQDLLDRLTGQSPADADPGGLWDVQGFPGAGKSILLREVERHAGPQDAVVLVEMQDYFTAFERNFENSSEAADSLDGRGGELRRFSQAVSAVISGLRDRRAAGDAVETILNDIAQVVTAARDEGLEQDEAAGTLIGRVQEEVNRLISARTEPGGRVFVLVDTFELVKDRPLGRWFGQLLAGLPGAVVIIARRVAGSEDPVLPDATVLPVGGLPARQVRDYLVRRLGSLGAELAELVYNVTGGHALAVGLIADTAGDAQHSGQPVSEFAGRLQQLESRASDPMRVLDILIDWFIDTTKRHEPPVEQALQCLWVVRRFDFVLLESLLKVGDPDAGHRLAERLVGYSFVERRSASDRPTEHYYVVHDHVRRRGLTTLRGTDEGEQRLRALNGAALDYYDDQTDEFLGSYEDWFRYEDSRWTGLVREWLYHVAEQQEHQGGAGPTDGQLGLARRFFDAFWWWGYNFPFRFCEDLIADWLEMAVSLSDGVNREWGENIRDLYARWPRNWRRTASSGELEIVKKCIEYFRAALGRVSEERVDEHVRHVRGLVCIFLSLAEQYLDPSSADAKDLLLEARGLFIENEDQWNTTWVLFQLADAALLRRDLPAAIATAAKGWQELTSEEGGDPEVAANLHRVHADAAWENGQRGLALDLYARAALHAYNFQVNVGSPEIPPIDEYTQGFLTQMHERAAERITALRAAGDGQVAGLACARIRQFFAPYWRAASAAGLVADQRADQAMLGLFPPPPAAADLHRPDTVYARIATSALYEMEDELSKPPGTPCPPLLLEQ